jgi:hypothetical protein
MVALAERPEAPPSEAARVGDLLDLFEAAERDGAEINRGAPLVASERGGGPGGGEELLAHRHEVRGARPYPLGLDHQHLRAGCERRGEKLEVLGADECPGERLRPGERGPGGDRVGDLGEFGALDGERLGALPYLGREE